MPCSFMRHDPEKVGGRYCLQHYHRLVCLALPCFAGRIANRIAKIQPCSTSTEAPSSVQPAPCWAIGFAFFPIVRTSLLSEFTVPFDGTNMTSVRSVHPRGRSFPHIIIPWPWSMRSISESEPVKRRQASTWMMSWKSSTRMLVFFRRGRHQRKKTDRATNMAAGKIALSRREEGVNDGGEGSFQQQQ
jgi:hypothetical protein